MDWTCAFCGEHKLLGDSHVLPAFVYRWLRSRSGTGHIRHSENPNRRVQDGLKLHWLCDDCEGHFSRYETAFATKVFHPWHSGQYRIAYEGWLLKFCVSVSWRVLKYARGNNRNAPYSDEQRELMDRAEAHWRAFLKDEVPHPAQFEQHLLIFDTIDATGISNLPTNFNRFMTGAVTLDIVGSERSVMTFAKLGRFMIFGIIQNGPNQWDGTKIHVKHGLLKPDKFTVPAGLLDLFREKAQNAAAAMSKISPAQRVKIGKHVSENLDAFARSDQFASILADAAMFGEDAVLWKDEP
ncbi:MAG: hypothetical protein ACR652_01335 [Methylocystis sp.]|uniref:hypothetical protein n=1 Tax=Methylocystis sp. TaxID=1911079 RepID=UPI003DA359E0